MFKTGNEAGNRAMLEKTTLASSTASADDDPTALQRTKDSGNLVDASSVHDDDVVEANGLTRAQNRRLDVVMQRDASGDSHLNDRRTAWRSPAADDNAVVALQLQAAAPVHRVPDCDLDANREQKPQVCRAQLV